MTDLDELREHFEAWAKGLGYLVNRDMGVGNYSAYAVNLAWIAVQSLARVCAGQSVAWEKVFDTLEEESPGWLDEPGSAEDNAVRVIRHMSRKAIALDDWLARTNWVQEQCDTFPINALGLHRADVMRQEIETLRATVLHHITAKWIPTSDQLPPLDQDVLMVRDGVRAVGCRYGRHDGSHGYTFCSSSIAGDHFKPQYWQPLPPLPGV